MNHDADIRKLYALVQTCFHEASNQTDISKTYRQWKSCASLAGVASIRLGLEGACFTLLHWKAWQSRQGGAWLK